MKSIVHVVLISCAWVVWGDYYFTGAAAPNGVSGQGWERNAAYPDYDRCVREAQNRAEWFAGLTGPNVKRQEYRRLAGDQHSVQTDHMNGGMTLVTFFCLPDTIDPRRPK